MRQVRLNTDAQIKSRIKDLVSKKVNIVLNDRKVLLGEFQSIEQDNLLFRNMRQQPFKLSLSQISEIYFDIDA